ncbi:hypothetical protein IC006_1026 [Sulfuracidifex tepidarius]|uniref:Uncharacterized protein n=1 Tax=Sulfuracidifex tepidarius TaxID=1294262 RepID=A0A510DU82_9CREN|nr:hypothetical protein IC006_1026 [Sulfuracidifex tepidarius]BBG26489.1 hypothetical protein IC007_1000 [Sulfuracidifex tepidarius]
MNGGESVYDRLMVPVAFENHYSHSVDVDTTFIR